ncbi:MAG TPA: hypothetical protein VFZ61_04335 [Polyangiales bacterium]
MRLAWSSPAVLWTLGTLLFLAGLWFAGEISAARARRRGRAHNLRGQRGERDAERLLRRAGYTVRARQLRCEYSVEVGDETLGVALQADYLVERAGQRLVAEVKTGRHAPRFEHADTRRQLLEYQLAFEVDAVLLVDVEHASLREVRFPVSGRPAHKRAPGLAWLVAAGITLVLYGVLRR